MNMTVTSCARTVFLAIAAVAMVSSAHGQVQFGSALDQTARVESIEVFRRGAQAITNSDGATVYVVDELKGFTERLSANLPNTEAAAQRVAQSRLQALSEADKSFVQRAATAQVRAAQYGITKTPAVVFDHHAVVYGVFDMAEARRIYLRWRSAGARR